jgi:hypothetical protein
MLGDEVEHIAAAKTLHERSAAIRDIIITGTTLGSPCIGTRMDFARIDETAQYITPWMINGIPQVLVQLCTRLLAGRVRHVAVPSSEEQAMNDWV